MTQLNLDISELISHPSPASKKVIKIIKSIYYDYQKKLTQKNLRRLIFITKIKLYQKQNYKQLYLYLKNYQILLPSTLSKSNQLKILFSEFSKLQQKLIFNNFALASLASLNQFPTTSNILTIEDEKIIYLQKIANNQISRLLFNKKFGHYALNPYELSEPRFTEYKSSQLKKLAKLTLNINIKSKKKLENYIKSEPANHLAILIGLRELFKSTSLKVIKQIRDILLLIEKEQRIDNIFNLSYKQIQKKSLNYNHYD